MKSILKTIAILSILVTGIFMLSHNNTNQVAQADPETKYCELYMPGWGDCDMTPANCLCPIIVEED